MALYQFILASIMRCQKEVDTKPSFSWGGSPRDAMVKALDCNIVVSELELQSRNYVHFRTNTLRRGMTPPFPPSYGLNITITVLQEEWLGINSPTKVNMPLNKETKSN